MYYARLVQEQGYPQLPFIGTMGKKYRFSLDSKYRKAYGIARIEKGKYLFQIAFDRLGERGMIDAHGIQDLLKIDEQGRMRFPHELFNDFDLQPGATICGRVMEVFVKQTEPLLKSVA